MITGSGTFHEDFRLSITKALGDQLSDALAKLGRAPLTEASLALVNERPGVYQLYLDGQFVYVGKAEKSLRDRLGNHLRKLSGRRNIELSEVMFSCLYVAEDFSALAPEQLLISRHKDAGEIPWNSNGFGNKDPGRQRDKTILKAKHFDVAYPINLDLPVEGLTEGQYTLDTLLAAVKSGLPYVFRFEKMPRAKSTVVQIDSESLTADGVFRAISAAVPSMWQITVLMGYVIMYAESTIYDSAWRYYRGGVPVDAAPETEEGDVDTAQQESLELDG